MKFARFFKVHDLTTCESKVETGVSGLRPPRDLMCFDPWHVTCSPPIEKCIWSWKNKQVQYSLVPSLTIAGGVLKP